LLSLDLDLDPDPELDPDLHLFKSLDPYPHIMNANPKHCVLGGVDFDKFFFSKL
jgi:hypothetical protein